jgi:putative hydrolase of the HAD superfamily
MIFFDIDGTLIDHASASRRASINFYEHFRARIPYRREDFPAIWEGILNKHFERFCRGDISLFEQRRARMRELFPDEGLTEEESDRRYRVFARSYQSETRAFADVRSCLEQLRGRRLGIISNGAREQQMGKLARAGLLNHFSVMVFSEDIGLGKPAPRIFLEACRLASIEPAGSTHVGDDPRLDFAGSRDVGMKPIWLNRGRLAGNGLPRPSISSLRELAFAIKPSGDCNRLTQA